MRGRCLRGTLCTGAARSSPCRLQARRASTSRTAARCTLRRARTQRTLGARYRSWSWRGRSGGAGRGSLLGSCAAAWCRPARSSSRRRPATRHARSRSTAARAGTPYTYGRRSGSRHTSPRRTSRRSTCLMRPESLGPQRAPGRPRTADTRPKARAAQYVERRSARLGPRLGSRRPDTRRAGGRRWCGSADRQPPARSDAAPRARGPWQHCTRHSPATAHNRIATCRVLGSVSDPTTSDPTASTRATEMLSSDCPGT
mmetsp:Transcript_19901/g.47362  ORF Transcript_19901/g.47362 Transcript_19901/m.47362 type:complete len:257 (-) Transcript_19901:1851-2621(-)